MDDVARLSELLFGYENLLLDPVHRADAESIANLFTEDFRQFGKSGRSYNKAEILEFLRDENLPKRKVRIEDFNIKMLADSAVLATYITVVEDEPHSRALRSSIWVAHEGEWRIAFHQGTTSGVRL